MAERSHSWSRPVLDEKAVRQALEAMRSGKNLPPHHPLRYFVGIQQQTAAPHVLGGDVPVQLAVFSHLTEAIGMRRTALRDAEEGASETACDSRNIEWDFRQNNPELEAWTVLFYRYVCASAPTSLQSLAELVHQDERTLRRRYQVGLTLLTRHLVEREQETRRQQRRAVQQSQLPSPVPPRLFGVDSLLDTVEHVLTDGEPPRHVVLTGVMGVGKTSAALALAHRVIQSERYDDLLWLDGSGRKDWPVSSLFDEVQAHLGLSAHQDADTEQVVSTLLMARRVILFLDHADTLCEGDLDAVLARFSQVDIVIMSRHYAPSSQWVYHIQLEGIARDAIFHMIERAADLDGNKGARQCLRHFDAIWQQLGGIVGAWRLVMGAANSLPVATAVSEVVSGSFLNAVWGQLAGEEWQVLTLPLLFRHFRVTYEELEAIAGPLVARLPHVLSELTGRGLLCFDPMAGTYHYTFAEATESMLVTLCLNHDQVSHELQVREYLLDRIAIRVRDLEAASCSASALHILKHANVLGLPANTLCGFLMRLAPQIEEGGDWYSWSVLLSQIRSSHQDAWPCRECQLWYAVAQRHLGYLADAEALLTNLVDSQQDIRSYAGAACELAVVLRYRGQWDRASELLESALQAYAEIAAEDGVARCVLELAQLALEIERPSRALSVLGRLGKRTPRSLAIAGQAHLMLHEPARALSFVYEALNLLPESSPQQGRVLALLGQVYFELARHSDALETTRLAIGWLDQARDLIGFARASNNLAIMYAATSHSASDRTRAEMGELLERALAIQEGAGDVLGAAVTRQNIDWFGD